MPGTNALAYYEKSYTAVKSFITLKMFAREKQGFKPRAVFKSRWGFVYIFINIRQN